MTQLRPSTSPLLLAAILVSSLAVFAADWYLPLGIAVWVLYFVPIALSKFAWRPSAPILTALSSSILIFVGYIVSPGADSAAATYAPISRTFGLVTFWIAAAIGRQFILSRVAVAKEDRIKAGLTTLYARIQGELNLDEVSQRVLSFFVDALGAQAGLLYVADGHALRRTATIGTDGGTSSPIIERDQGLVGRVLQSAQLLHLAKVPDSYFSVRSGLGGRTPTQLVIAPAEVDGKVQAIIELAFLSDFAAEDLELLRRASQVVASGVRSVQYRMRQAELLEETQQQAEELQAQQEELKVQNEELEQQSSMLQDSQSRLEAQQAELEQINAQLEEQAQSLERQRDDLARSQDDIARANRYKSEFLANMSHELRTPLNSSLILAKLLMDNREGNLSEEQIKFAQTIYSAGNDLLTLINDILDLSKIEAGKLDVRPDTVSLKRIVDELTDSFRPIARDKQLELHTEIEPGLPSTMHTDVVRLQQVLKNLMSNAFKFTDRGGVWLRVRAAGDQRVRFEVQDTGIGIALDQQQLIFDAFRQADGTSNRKYGGTGLGLSISRDLSQLLGGELAVESTPGRGSTFHVTVPLVFASAPSAKTSTPSPRPQPPLELARPAPPPAPPQPRETLAEQRVAQRGQGRTILIIEDDTAFSDIVADLARELDFQPIVAHDGEQGMARAMRDIPSAIVLDVGLPDRSGLTVLDALKHDPRTRHIPVHMISASDYALPALEMGAAGYAIKPLERDQLMVALKRLEDKLTKKVRRVLVVEDDPVHRESTCRLVEGDDVETVAVGTAAEALEHLKVTTFDCMVLDLTLPDRSGLELLEEMSGREQYGFPPVVVYTGHSLSREEEQQLRRFSQSIIVKGARSPERLLDEVTLFLHQVEADLPAERQRMLRSARSRESAFEGRRILVVEDDVRNIFALSSVLEPKGARVEIARNGKEALQHLRTKPGVDLVLMDIMMPEMDGITATREIRKMPELAKLPIIALTAKAMVDDRESCLAAGANDYIAKPLDVDKLLSLARVWMPK